MKFIILTCVASYFCLVQGQQQSCSGRCISIYSCEPLLKLATNTSRSQADTLLIRNALCGYEGQIPKVCCPPAKEQADSVSTSSDFCFTPDAQEGNCVELNSCQHLVSLSNNDETRAFIQNSKCGENRVCCGNQPPNFGPKNGECLSTVAPQYPGSGCCGVEIDAGDKIVGGNDADIYQYPWAVLIEYTKKRWGETVLLCGGSLISGRYVLTAGHCVKGSVLNNQTPRNVRLGEHDTSNDPASRDCVKVGFGDQECNGGAIIIPIEKITAHEDYKPTSSHQRNDIALLRLTRMAPYTNFIRPICLPQTDVTLSNIPDISLFVAGWGAVNTTISSSAIKQFVDVPYVNMEKCQPYRVGIREVSLWEAQICAGGEPNKDSCKGDSGGPLMYKMETKKHFDLVGVVSFGPIPCGIEDKPGVYTKVYNYLQWIRKNIEP